MSSQEYIGDDDHLSGRACFWEIQTGTEFWTIGPFQYLSDKVDAFHNFHCHYHHHHHHDHNHHQQNHDNHDQGPHEAPPQPSYCNHCDDHIHPFNDLFDIHHHDHSGKIVLHLSVGISLG